MGVKGSNSSCCCPESFIRLAPNVFAPGALSIVRLQDFCCECVPKYVCISLYLSSNLYERVAFFISEWNCIAENSTDTRLGNYYGVLEYYGLEIDVSIEYYKDADGICWICMRSELLGHVGSGRVCHQLGGDYNSFLIRKEECLHLGQSFSATLPYGQDVTIYVAPIDFAVPSKCKTCGSGTYRCVCRRMVFTYERFDYNGVYQKETKRACVTEDIYTGERRWTLTFFDDTVTIVILDILNTPRTWRLFVSGDGPEPYYRDFILPACPDEFGNFCVAGATWDEWVDGSFGKLTVLGEPYDYCSDCKYICKTICVLFFSEKGSDVVSAVLDENGQWIAEYLGERYVFALTCTGCTDRVTAISLTASVRIMGDNPAPIGNLCPIDIAATWRAEFAPRDVGFISVSCSKCGTCPPSIPTPCCPAALTPRAVFVTFVFPTCSYLHGVSVRLSYSDSPPLPYDPIPGWIGLIDVLQCTDVDYLPATDVRVQLSCIGVIWILKVKGEGWMIVPPTAPGLGYMLTRCPISFTWTGIGPESTCAPLELQFLSTYLTEYTQTCCCIGVPPNFSAVVTA